MKMKKQKEISRTAITIVAGAIITAAVALEILAGFLFGKGVKAAWDVCYNMTNQRIEWGGAGYNGIYGRETGNE